MTNKTTLTAKKSTKTSPTTNIPSNINPCSGSIFE
jgi:hypothetical protein